MAKHAAPLSADAANRSVRTLLQGLAVDIAVAVAAVLLSSLGSLDLTDTQALQALGLLLAKTVLTAVASYVMRRFVDTSAVPTPLPPDPVPEPNDAGAVDLRDLLLIAVVVVLVVVIIAVF